MKICRTKTNRQAHEDIQDKNQQTDKTYEDIQDKSQQTDI